jgi:predicted nucleotidyltransferase
MVRGEAKETSDVDLLVEFNKPISLFSFIDLQEMLAGLVHRPVDLVTRKGLKPRIGKRILEEALPL